MQGAWPTLAGPDGDYLRKIGDEDVAPASAFVSTFGNRLDGDLQAVVIYSDFEANSAKETHLLRDAPIHALLRTRASALDSRSGHMPDLRIEKSLLDGRQLLWPNHSNNEFHLEEPPI